MIELLLQAERALSMGMVDQAERLYRQAADADPRNSIAVVGLARVALERADDAEAWRQAKRALEIDPENAAAQRLVDRLEEVWRHKRQAPASSVPVALQPAPAAAAGSAAVAPEPTPASGSMDVEPTDVPMAAGSAAVAPEPTPASGSMDVEPTGGAAAPASRTPPSAVPPHQGLVDRMLRRNRA